MPEGEYSNYIEQLTDCLSALDTFLSPFVPSPRLEDLKRCETAALFFAGKALAPLVRESGDPTGMWLQRIADEALRGWLATHSAALPGTDAIEIEPQYALVACHIRGPVVPEARRSIYHPSMRLVGQFGATHSASNDLLRVCIPSFYGGLVYLLFELLGRTTTLVECVLDSTRLLDKSEVMIIFEDELDGEIKLDNRGDRVSLSLPGSLWKSLIHDPYGNDLRGALWNTCWDAMCAEMHLSDPPKEGSQTGQIKDALDASAWFSPAIESLGRINLKGNLALARVTATTRLAKTGWGAAFPTAETFFENEYQSAGPLAALDSLLGMVQGMILFVPWAAENGTPVPVVMHPARHTAEGGLVFRSGLEFRFQSRTELQTGAIDTHRKDYVPVLKAFVEKIDGIFNRVHQRYKKSSRAAIVSPPKGIPPKLWNIVTSKGLGLGEFRETVRDVIKISQSLSGHLHEGLPTEFKFVVAGPEFLKHVEHVISRETFLFPFDEARSSECSKSEMIERTVASCKSHFSIFRDDRIAAYIDPYHGAKGCELSEVVLLSEPGLGDYFRRDFRLRNTPFRSAQLASSLPPDTQWKAVVVATDPFGNIRVFNGGREVLRRRRGTANEPSQWTAGIDSEYPDYPQPRVDLSVAILRGLGVEETDKEGQVFSDDLATVLLEISEEPGAGALVVLVPKGERYRPGMFTTLAPSGTVMKWARPHRTAHFQPKFLKCQAILDGAVVISCKNRGDYYIESRKFVLPAPFEEGKTEMEREVLDADRIAERLEKWTKKVGAQEEWVTALKKLRTSLATMGARHRAATLVCLTNPRLTAVTVSSDGPIRVFESRETEDGEVILFPRQIL